MRRADGPIVRGTDSRKEGIPNGRLQAPGHDEGVIQLMQAKQHARPAVEGAGRSWEPGGTAGALVTRSTPCLPHTPPAGCSPPTPREDRDRLETNILLSSPRPAEIHSSRFPVPRASQTRGCDQHSPRRPLFDQPMRGRLRLRTGHRRAGWGRESGSLTSNDSRGIINSFLLQQKKKKEKKKKLV